MDTVWKWRKALGVGASTEGTHRLRSVVHADHLREARGLSPPTWDEPARRAKISEAKRGKPRPPHVAEAVRRAHTGTTASEETRKRMSEAHRRRGTLVPGTNVWTPEED